MGQKDSNEQDAGHYQGIIKVIAEEIEGLKGEFPQMKEFKASDQADLSGLTVRYGFRTHKPEHRGGWTSGVPNPDEGGIWFHIDLHAPDSMAQIHKQPVMPDLCIGKMKLTFLILEGVKTKKVSGRIWGILQKHGAVECP